MINDNINEKHKGKTYSRYEVSEMKLSQMSIKSKMLVFSGIFFLAVTVLGTAAIKSLAGLEV